MNNQLFSSLIILLLLCTTNTNSQNKIKNDIREIESFYSENYSPPLNVEFIFDGDSEYRSNFYSDLEKEIIEKFKNTIIEISFRYIDSEKHYSSKIKNESNPFKLHLKVFNAKVTNEKNGFDREGKFNFSGYLKSDKNSENLFSFKSEVYTIHDINSNNENIAEYLFSKLYLR